MWNVMRTNVCYFDWYNTYASYTYVRYTVVAIHLHTVNKVKFDVTYSHTFSHYKNNKNMYSRIAT